MSRIVSFSTDNEFAENLDNLIKKSGYKNRSRFLRDATLYFAEIQQKGELMNMSDSISVEGHLVVYYQQANEQKLMVNRNGAIDIAAYHHSSRLGHSCHSCVDVVHIKGQADHVRNVFEKLKNTPSVDKVSFVSAPMRDDGCC